MVQNIMLCLMVILSMILVISMYEYPFGDYSLKYNLCKFKILSPKFKAKENKKVASFDIIIEKCLRYFIHFPLSFKFYSKKDFKSRVKIYYSTPHEKYSELLLDKVINFSSIPKDFVLYITQVILGKITVEIEIDTNVEKPIIEFQILENSICNLSKEQKLKIKFP